MTCICQALRVAIWRGKCDARRVICVDAVENQEKDVKVYPGATAGTEKCVSWCWLCILTSSLALTRPSFLSQTQLGGSVEKLCAITSPLSLPPSPARCQRQTHRHRMLLNKPWSIVPESPEEAVNASWSSAAFLMRCKSPTCLNDALPQEGSFSFKAVPFAEE